MISDELSAREIAEAIRDELYSILKSFLWSFPKPDSHPIFRVTTFSNHGIDFRNIMSGVSVLSIDVDCRHSAIIITGGVQFVSVPLEDPDCFSRVVQACKKELSNRRA